MEHKTLSNTNKLTTAMATAMENTTQSRQRNLDQFIDDVIRMFDADIPVKIDLRDMKTVKQVFNRFADQQGADLIKTELNIIKQEQTALRDALKLPTLDTVRTVMIAVVDTLYDAEANKARCAEHGYSAAWADTDANARIHGHIVRNGNHPVLKDTATKVETLFQKIMADNNAMNTVDQLATAYLKTQRCFDSLLMDYKKTVFQHNKDMEKPENSAKLQRLEDIDAALAEGTPETEKELCFSRFVERACDANLLPRYATVGTDLSFKNKTTAIKP